MLGKIKITGLASWRQFERTMGRGRLIRLSAAFLLTLVLFLPILSQINIYARYNLDAKTVALIGPDNQNLAKKFSYDTANDQWQFNKDGSAEASTANQQQAGIAGALNSLQQQTGGGGAHDASLYSVNLPSDAKKGITYFDNNTDLSFSISPQFNVGRGMANQGRLIYPFGKGGKLVYTAKNNGMKEDIVLSHNIGDQVVLNFKLNLPDTLEAKVLDDGSIGIFSADPALFGNIQFASDADRSRVENARKNGEKDHLLFGLPAPVIKDSSSGGTMAPARFVLNGNQLTVAASGLGRLTYPLSIDPSVTVSSSSDFATNGNNEGNIDFPTDQINRGALTGGNVGNYSSGTPSSSWTSTNSFTTSRVGLGAVAYNGYIYVFGGSNGGTALSDIQCSAIGSGGTLSTWHISPYTLTYGGSAGAGGRENFGIATYDGYVYIGGGDQASGGSNLNDVIYAQMVGGTNCVNGNFVTTSSFGGSVDGGIRRGLAMTAYNGYLYLQGGLEAGTQLNDTQYAPIHADGTIGSWTATTSIATGVTGVGIVAYNDYLYSVGGKSSGGYVTTVQYAKIGSDGTVGSWVSTTALPQGRNNIGLLVNNGYMYVLAGAGQGAGTVYNDALYISINANGSLGSAANGWITSSSSITTARDLFGAVVNNGYLYALGGENTSGTELSDTQYGKIDAAGQIDNFRTDSGVPATPSVKGAASFAMNGYVFLLGGLTPTNIVQKTVYKGTINDNGTLTWAPSTSMGTAVWDFGFAYYNGYIYAVGGCTNSACSTMSSAVQYAVVKQNGNMTWGTTTALGTSAGKHPAAAYGGYLFYASTGGSGTDTHIQAAQISLSNGTIGSWTTQTATLGTGVNRECMVAYNNYLYVIGGNNNSTTYYNIVQKSQLNLGGAASSKVGTFSNDASMVDSRADFGAVIADGYLYVVGGTNSGGDLSTGEFTLINSNGSLAGWTKSVSFGSSVSSNAVSTTGGNIYLVNGNVAGAGVTNSRVLTINNGGSGGTATFTSTTALTGVYTTWDMGQAFAANNYLYIVGGYDGTSSHAETYSAPINADGSIGSWSAQSSLNTARYDFGLITANGYVYVAGGITSGTTRTASVEYAQIQSNGALGSWQNSSHSLGTALSSVSMATYNNYAYVLGGNNGTSQVTTVSQATLPASGGDLSSNWTSTSSFTTAREDAMAVAYNGYIYLIGGYNGTDLQDVQYSALNSSTGAVSGWATTTPMPATGRGSVVAAADGYIYLVGGINSTANTTGMAYEQVVPILSNGTLGDWQFNGQIASGNKYGELAGTLYNGVLYEIGGANGNGVLQNTASYGAINAQPRIGMYSKLIDLGATATYSVTTVTYNGTLPNGISGVTVRTADPNGIFGAARAGSNLSSTPDKCAGVATRYIWFSVTIDDSQTAVYGDTTGTAGNVTDITINYGAPPHPDPQFRLRGGKFFSSQVLQPLDTCGA